MFWSDKPNVYARDFLPENTSFYYQWTDNRSIKDNPWHSLEFFDDSITDMKLSEVSNILTNSQSRLEELVWFKTESDKDNYLLRLSSISQTYVDQLKTDYPELVFYRPHKKILLITDSQELSDNLPKLLLGKFTVNNIDTGVSMYWNLDNPPEFLQKLSTWLQPMFVESEIFVNFQKTGGGLKKINAWQIKDQQIANNFFINSRRLKDFDNVFGMSASSTQDFDSFIDTNILQGQFKYKKYFFDNNIIWQHENNWLMASDQDWQALSLDLASSFDLEEVTKVLSDGTAYVELVASSSPEIVQHAYYEKNYWQIDGLYGAEREGVYYLSNKQYLIEDILSSDYMISSAWANCLDYTDIQINDFLILQTNKLANSPIKQYLESQDINNLKFISYSNNNINAWQLCF